MKIESTEFAQGQPIGRRYTGDGEDVSPPLNFTDVPAATVELALICDDPDAPTARPWVHWVIYKIPGDARGLPEGIKRLETLTAPAGALQGENSWPSDNVGYRGPAPPPGSGPHRYYFKLYALDAALDVKPGLDKQELLDAMNEHILAEAQLFGTYER